ncbi:Transposase IS4 [Popillia japonica]|uniref:Transposase IS4 n=1 Tax=Popillia japonica TaxID=7064 RepID=A0AAW1M1P5_POPJA
MIVTESNKYAQERNRKTVEVKRFIGVLLFSGYVQVPRMRMLWEREQDTYNKLIAEAISRDRFEYILSYNYLADEAISRDRFEYILSYNYLADNTNLAQSDKFAKARPLFDHLKNKFIEYAPIDHCL